MPNMMPHRSNGSIESPIQLDETASQSEDDPNLSPKSLIYEARNGSDSVSISEADLQCLAAGAPLSSPIMNFYITYLQNANDQTHDKYKFFSTFFYPKMREKILDSDEGFETFRKWWKEENLFEKTYIFVPVHYSEKFHWSLVLIHNPPNPENLSSIIMHLDPLNEVHDSKKILRNIKRFLNKEWKLLSPNTSRNIVMMKLKVPQQTNGYDCGIFVLFFIECILNESIPLQYGKNFQKDWIREKKPSELRCKIRSMLNGLFYNMDKVFVPSNKISSDEKALPSSTNENVEEKKKKSRTNGDGNCEIRVSQRVMKALKDLIKAEGHYEEDRFEDTYPYLNDALKKEGGKILFMQKLKSIRTEELEEIEKEFKQVARLKRKARNCAAKAINKLHTKWLVD